MKSLKEAVYLLKNSLSQGAISDDSPIPNRRLLSKLLGVITMLKHRNLAKGIDFSTEDIITLSCVELIEIERVEGLITPSGRTWKKSVAPLPNFIKILNVGDVLGNITIPIINWNAISSHVNSRVKQVRESPICAFRNSGDGVYLYALTPNKALSATLIVTDPIDAYLFPKCGEESKFKCDYWEIPINTSDSLLSEAVQFLVAEELKINASVRPDQIANDNPS